MSRFWRQPLLHKPTDPPRMSPIGCLQMFANPLLNVSDFWPLIRCDSLAGSKLCETDAEAHVVYVLVNNDVVGSTRHRRILKQLQKRFAGVAPTLHIFVHESGRVGECLGKRDDCCFAIEWSSQLLCVWEDDGEVERNVDTSTQLVRSSSKQGRYLIYPDWTCSVMLMKKSAPRPWSSRADTK